MRVDQLSQVTISPPATRGGRKIHGLNDTGTKKMWVEKFKSTIVTSTKRVDRIITRTKRGWIKHQGTTQNRLSYRFGNRFGGPSTNFPIFLILIWTKRIKIFRPQYTYACPGRKNNTDPNSGLWDQTKTVIMSRQWPWVSLRGPR
jgi:hypothetical protein